jgi:hypothetical protein
MTQALYAHMNNKTIKKSLKNISDGLRYLFFFFAELGFDSGLYPC